MLCCWWELACPALTLPNAHVTQVWCGELLLLLLLLFCAWQEMEMKLKDFESRPQKSQACAIC